MPTMGSPPAEVLVGRAPRSHDRRTSRAFLGVALAFTSLTLLVCVASGLTGSLHRSVLLTAGVLMLLILGLGFGGWTDPGDAILFFPILLWIVFGLVPTLSHPAPGQTDRALLALGTSALTASYRLVIVALMAYIVGYLLRARRSPLRALPQSQVALIMPQRLLVVAALVTIARVYLLVIGQFGYAVDLTRYNSTLGITGPLGALSSLSWYVILLASLRAFAPAAARSDRVVFRALLSLEFAFGLFSGMKGGLIYTGLAFVLGYLYATARIPWKTIGVGLALFLVIVPSVQRYRLLLNQSGARGVSPAATLRTAQEAAAQALTSNDVSGRLQLGAEFLVGRIDGLRAFALVHDKTPAVIPFEGGRHYAVAPFMNVIPRLLWPTKPIIDTTTRDTVLYYENITTHNSTTRTLIGDFYINFGVFGVAFGMFGVGLAIGTTRTIFVTRRTLLSLMLYCVAILTLLLRYESDFTSILAGLPREALSVWLLTFYVTAGRIRQRPTSPAAISATT